MHQRIAALRTALSKESNANRKSAQFQAELKSVRLQEWSSLIQAEAEFPKDCLSNRSSGFLRFTSKDRKDSLFSKTLLM